MSQASTESLQEAVAAFAGARVLVIGDIIVDHFLWGSVTRISPEAPVPVVNVTRESLLLGGAANVLHNLHSLGARTALCGVVGQDAMGDHLLALLADLGAATAGVVRVDDRPTIKKTRIIAQNQQVVRVDRECNGPLPLEGLERLFTYLDEHLGHFDAVVISDYAKGLISPEFMQGLRDRLATRKPVPLVVDPKPGQPERLVGATVVTPNHHEAELMSGVAITDAESLLAAATRLRRLLDCRAVLITRGEAGMALFEKDKPMFTIPTVAKEVYDVTGAGDTVAATLALGLAVGLDLAAAASLANIAAGIVVGKVGTATVATAELLKALP